MDTRGNKEGVSAQFSPSKEQLAFVVQSNSKRDLPKIWVDPLGVVIRILEGYRAYDQVPANLPDIG